MTIFRFDTRPDRYWLRWLAGIAIVIALLAGVRLWMLRSFDGTPLPPALASVARLPITLASGRPALLGEVIKPGLPTVITLWASWCGPCRAEAGDIAALRQRFGPGKLNLVYLNVRDPDATASDLASYMKEYGMAPDGYAVLADERIASLTNAPDRLIPRTLIFDRAGTPLGTVTGYNPFALSRIEGLIAS